MAHHEAIADGTFSELGYASTSAGITRIRDAHKAAWREHAVSNKQLILGGAEASPRVARRRDRRRQALRYPLHKLAERFEQLLLVDIDLAALSESVEQAALDPKLAARLSLVHADVTGINDVFLERARAALALADEDEVYGALLRLLHEYRVDEPPRLVPEHAAQGPLDFACSSMVLSQLATPLTVYVQQRFAQRFPASQRAQGYEFQVALGRLRTGATDHVRSLLLAAPCVARAVTLRPIHASTRRNRPTPRCAASLGPPALDHIVPLQRISTGSRRFSATSFQRAQAHGAPCSFRRRHRAPLVGYSALRSPGPGTSAEIST